MLIIDPSGTITQTKIKGKVSLDKLQRLVGGYIEIVRLPGRNIAIVNEDGIGLGMAINPIASQTIGVPVVGTVVILPASALP